MIGGAVALCDYYMRGSNSAIGPTIHKLEKYSKYQALADVCEI